MGATRGGGVVFSEDEPIMTETPDDDGCGATDGGIIFWAAGGFFLAARFFVISTRFGGDVLRDGERRSDLYGFALIVILVVEHVRVHILRGFGIRCAPSGHHSRWRCESNRLGGDTHEKQCQIAANTQKVNIDSEHKKCQSH